MITLFCGKRSLPEQWILVCTIIISRLVNRIFITCYSHFKDVFRTLKYEPRTIRGITLDYFWHVLRKIEPPYNETY